MTRRFITSGSSFERDIGYARAVVDGDWIFVSGTTGFDYAAGTIAVDVVEQCRQCLRNIRVAMEEAGFSLGDAVRVHYLFPDRADFEPCWPLLRGRLRRRSAGRHHDGGRARGSAHEDRDRGHGQAPELTLRLAPKAG